MTDLSRKRLESLLNSDVSTMDEEQLTELNTELSLRREAVREKQREVTAELDRHLIEREARLILEAMSIEQRAALTKIVREDSA